MGKKILILVVILAVAYGAAVLAAMFTQNDALLKVAPFVRKPAPVDVGAPPAGGGGGAETPATPAPGAETPKAPAAGGGAASPAGGGASAPSAPAAAPPAAATPPAATDSGAAVAETKGEFGAEPTLGSAVGGEKKEEKKDINLQE